MKILITQPTFLPWIGYYDLIEKSDITVFLDDVQFERRSWQQRNKIKTANGLEWITLPVLSKGNRAQLIKDVTIDLSNKSILKIKKTIEFNYKKSIYFDHYYNDFVKCFDINLEKKNLLNLNTCLIKHFLKILKIKKDIFYSSEVNIVGSKSMKIINICNYFKAKKYISTLGSENYLKNDLMLFHENKIEILIHNYVHPIYKQCFSPFSSHACIIDLIFNEGNKALKILNIGELNLLK